MVVVTHEMGFARSVADRVIFMDDGRIVEKECVCLTFSFDHDIVDGAPAARFNDRLRELVNKAEGLVAG